MASKVDKSYRKNLIKNFYKSSKGSKVSAMALNDSVAGAAMLAVDADFASGYPSEVSKEWYSKLDNDQDKMAVGDEAAGVDSDCFSTATDSGNANKAFNRDSLNKPLPALPQPYFEYLFADADKKSSTSVRKTSSNVSTKSALANPHIDPVKRDSDGFSVPGRPASSYRNSIDDLSYESDDADSVMVLDDAPSPPSPGPVTPPFHLTPPVTVDLSAFSQYIFHQANVPYTTKDLVDSHLVAIGTGLQGPIPDINEQEELEKEQATASFFDGAKDSEGPFFPSPFAPETPFDQTTGVKEYDYTQGIPTEKLTGTTAASLDALDRAILSVGEYAEYPEDVEPVPAAVKPMLQPKSPKAKVQEKASIKSLTAKWIKRRQDKGQTISIDTSATNTTTSTLKRAASPSFETRSAPPVTDESVVYLGTKKIRTQSPPLFASHELRTPILPSSPVYDLTPDYITNPRPVYASYLSESPAPLTESPLPLEACIQFPQPINAAPTVIDLTAESPPRLPPTIVTTPEAPEYTPLYPYLPTPLTANYKGFAGQFIGPALNMFSAKTKMGAMKRPRVTEFGDRLHPNGEIIHKNCYPAATTPAWNYEPEKLSRHDPIFHAFLDLDECTQIAASEELAMLRTDEEEALRREAHIELALARLHGFPLGLYRYYQGHLTVEEYVDKGLCVCWSSCACSKVCSRYGDVMCPCGGDLELACDSDSDDE